MALPKLLIRTLRPYSILLVLGMFYAAYQQLQNSEQSAYQQSFANIKTASDLVSSQIEAAASKLYLLDDTKSLTQFDNTAKKILTNTVAYTDIIYVNRRTGQFRSVLLNSTMNQRNSSISWRTYDTFSEQFSVSSIYQKMPEQWVFAVRYTQPSGNEIWIEFDLKHTTQSLRGLRTLHEGYVFVVDTTTNRLVFHPDPSRIGTPSISYHAGISELIGDGTTFGKHEYYYQDQFKVSVFDSVNPYGWVFISGTSRSDILATSYQFSLSALVIASLLLIAVVLNYLIHQINQSLSALNDKQDLADFKQGLRQTLDRFCQHSGIQICFYDSDYGHFTTVDYHGNSRVILRDKVMGDRFVPKSLTYTGKRYADPLAQKLQINSRHYTIPLFDKENLIAVIYMKAMFPTYRSILRMIRDYSEVALTNLLLQKKLLSKDVMTQLDNKLTLREKIDIHLNSQDTYLAILDIDHFTTLNTQFGHQCGDQVILHTAELMMKYFQKPGAISLARYGGEEFCLLFKANDESHAFEQCEHLRQMVENSDLVYDLQQLNYTVSIGITVARESQNTTIGRADKALHQAKNLGRNQVVLNTF